MDSKCESTNTEAEVWDKSLFVGLNSKQKKNLRKKLQRQRKKREKLEGSQVSSSVGLDESNHDDEGDGGLERNTEIDDVDIDVGKEGAKKEEEKKEEEMEAVIKGESAINTLLSELEDKLKEKEQKAKEEAEKGP